MQASHLDGMPYFVENRGYFVKKTVVYNDVEWCRHNGVCGGCTYGGLTYESQKNEKEKKLKALLEPVFDEGCRFSRSR